MAIEKHFTVSELVDRLGLHRNTVQNLIREGAFPGAFKIGRTWRVPQSDVEAYLDRQRKRSA